MHKQVRKTKTDSGLLTFKTTYRLTAALAVIVAVVWQLVYSLDAYKNFSAINFLSFFTIDSNLIAAAVLLWTVLARKPSAALDVFRGAATLYMTITGIVFAILLTNIEVNLTLPVVDTILHKIIPLVMIIDWLFDPPRPRFTLKQIAGWFIFPAAWLIYTLVRGPMAQWYPYPFLDPRSAGGYALVSVYIIAIFVVGAIISAFLVFIANAVNHRRA